MVIKVLVAWGRQRKVLDLGSSVARNSTMSIHGDPGYNLLVFRVSHISLVFIGVIEHPCWDVLVQGHTEGTLIGQGVKKPGGFCES